MKLKDLIKEAAGVLTADQAKQSVDVISNILGERPSYRNKYANHATYKWSESRLDGDNKLKEKINAALKDQGLPEAKITIAQGPYIPGSIIIKIPSDFFAGRSTPEQKAAMKPQKRSFARNEPDDEQAVDDATFRDMKRVHGMLDKYGKEELLSWIEAVPE